MKHGIAFLALFVCLAGFGCDNTRDGMQTDARENSQSMNRAGNEALDKTQSAGEDIAAIGLTATIKNAYIANPLLNKSTVRIDVDSTAEEVTLNGHVEDDEQHRMAIRIAEESIKNANGTQRLVDNLVIVPSKESDPGTSGEPR